MKPVDLALLHSAEDAVAESFIVFLKLTEKTFHILPLGMLVLRAGALNYRKICMRGKVAYILFLCIKQGADHCQIGTRQI